MTMIIYIYYYFFLINNIIDPKLIPVPFHVYIIWLWLDVSGPRLFKVETASFGVDMASLTRLEWVCVIIK